MSSGGEEEVGDGSKSYRHRRYRRRSSSPTAKSTSPRRRREDASSTSLFSSFPDASMKKEVIGKLITISDVYKMGFSGPVISLIARIVDKRQTLYTTRPFEARLLDSENNEIVLRCAQTRFYESLVVNCTYCFTGLSLRPAATGHQELVTDVKSSINLVESERHVYLKSLPQVEESEITTLAKLPEFTLPSASLAPRRRPLHMAAIVRRIFPATRLSVREFSNSRGASPFGAAFGGSGGGGGGGGESAGSPGMRETRRQYIQMGDEHGNTINLTLWDQRVLEPEVAAPLVGTVAFLRDVTFEHYRGALNLKLTASSTVFWDAQLQGVKSLVYLYNATRQDTDASALKGSTKKDDTQKDLSLLCTASLAISKTEMKRLLSSSIESRLNAGHSLSSRARTEPTGSVILTASVARLAELGHGFVPDVAKIPCATIMSIHRGKVPDTGHGVTAHAMPLPRPRIQYPPWYIACSCGASIHATNISPGEYSKGALEKDAKGPILRSTPTATNTFLKDKAWCKRCSRETQTEPRYKLRIMVGDETGGTWCTAFDDVGNLLIGVPAAELARLDAIGDYDTYNSLMDAAEFRMYHVYMKVTRKTRNNKWERAHHYGGDGYGREEGVDDSDATARVARTASTTATAAADPIKGKRGHEENEGEEGGRGDGEERVLLVKRARRQKTVWLASDADEEEAAARTRRLTTSYADCVLIACLAIDFDASEPVV